MIGLHTIAKMQELYGFHSGFCKASKSEKLAGNAAFRHMYLAVSLKLSTSVFKHLLDYYMVCTKMMVN